MDTIINKLGKTVPLGMVVGCIMVEYGTLESIFYPGFSDNITRKIGSVFKKFSLVRTTEGTIITSKEDDEIDTGSGLEQIAKHLGYPCTIVSGQGTYVEIGLLYGKETDQLLTMYCKKIGSKELKFINKIEKFVEKINSKMDNPKNKLIVDVSSHKYFTIEKIREIVDGGKKLTTEHKNHIGWLLTKYGYGGGKNIFTSIKKNRQVLSTILRMVELEIKGFFNPTDTTVKKKIARRMK